MIDSFERDLFPSHIPLVKADDIIQLPLDSMTTSQSFRDAWLQYEFPKIISYQPECIFISSGFDGHHLV